MPRMGGAPVASRTRMNGSPVAANQRIGLRSAWCGPSLLTLDADGWAGRHALTGYWFRQTRFLHTLRLDIDGDAPYPCSLAEAEPARLEATYLHPEVSAGGGGGSGSGGTPSPGGVLYRDLDMRVTHRVRPASLETRLILVSRWQNIQFPLRWILSADFHVVDEALFPDRAETRAVVTRAASNGVVFECDGCGLPLETHIEARGADWSFESGTLKAILELQRQKPHEIVLRVSAFDHSDPIDDAGAKQRERRLKLWSQRRTRFTATADTPLVDIAERAADDLGSLALLEGPEEEWLTPAAGIPLYQSYWARDALTAAWQAGILDGGAMLRDTLVKLTRLQGTEVDDTRDEQPGRILNQGKTDLLSRTGRTGFDRYYADVASPFMYIIGLGYHYALTGDRAHVARHFDAAVRVTEWAVHYGDLNQDGYIEYLTRAEHGPKHQGWKDSDNAIVDADGRPIEPPIAACEIQGYWYVSLQYMAALSLVMGLRREATRYWRAARALKRRFNADFWLEDEGYIALGLGPDRAPIRALTSNAGQCLATGIVARERVPRLVERMFEPDLFSGWGIRTLSTHNPAYSPLDYHLGSVWPVENATIAFGLRRYGFDDRVHQLIRSLYDLASIWPEGRIPECVGGYARDEFDHPGAYPQANRPQTWNQSIWPMLLQCLLGLVPVAPLGLVLVDPILPPWLPEITLRSIRVGEATADLHFVRDGASHCEILHRSGPLRVVHQPWIESFSASRTARIGGLLRSLTSA